MQSRSSELLPSVALAFGAGLWGLFWIPVRGVDAAGVHAFWNGPVIFGASLILLLPIMLQRYSRFVEHWRSTLIPGLLAGFAFALYIASLNLTEVVRALLLFYMSPLWSTALGILLLGERLTVNRVVALLLAFCGLYVVLVVESGLPIPRNIGDWYALLSGLCWAIASVKLFQDGPRNIFEKASLFLGCALLFSLILAFGHQGKLVEIPSLAALHAAWYWIVILALMMLPVTWLTIWPATLLSPARVGMLLMVELVVGVGSAALLTDEPFGPREIAGALLILGAGVVEVTRRQTVVALDVPGE